MTLVTRFVRRILSRAGIDVVRIAPECHPIAQRNKILQVEEIDVVLDVGANKGQTGESLRAGGFEGRIISFEPLSAAFAVLDSKASSDSKWETLNCGIGDVNDTCEINISGNSASSSFLRLSDLGGASCPQAVFVGREEVEVRTLDSVFDQFGIEDQTIYLKIDTQGFERQVIEGARRILPQIHMIQMEMSLQPVYDNETLALDLMNLLSQAGYSLIATESGLVDPKTAHTLQIDGTFRRAA